MSEVTLSGCQMQSHLWDPKVGWKSPVCRKRLPPVSVCMKQWLCNSMLTIWSQSCGAVIMYQKGKKKKRQSDFYNPRPWFDQCLIHPVCVVAEVTVMTGRGLALCVCDSTLPWAGSHGTVGLVLNHSCRGRWRDRYLIQFLPGYLLLHWV